MNVIMVLWNSHLKTDLIQYHTAYKSTRFISTALLMCSRLAKTLTLCLGISRVEEGTSATCVCLLMLMKVVLDTWRRQMAETDLLFSYINFIYCFLNLSGTQCWWAITSISGTYSLDKCFCWVFYVGEVSKNKTIVCVASWQMEDIDRKETGRHRYTLRKVHRSSCLRAQIPNKKFLLAKSL